MSVITNKCNTDNVPRNFNDGDDVVRAADAAADRMCAVFTRLIETL
jgi:purine-nucleoside phosphorylase